MAIPLIIEVQLDDAAIQSGVDKLKVLGQIDEGQAAIFRKTNEQIQARKDLFSQVVSASDKLTLSISPQQEAYNRLNSSLNSLVGTSKAIATELLKLGSQTLFQGLKNSGLTVDQFVSKLKLAGIGTGQLDVNLSEVTQSVKDFVTVANSVNTDKLKGLGAISAADNSVVLQKTNDQIQERNTLLKDTIATTDKLSQSLSPQQVIYNKLADSVKNLSGASREAALQLLKLSPDQLAASFADAGVTTDEFATFLQKAADGQQDFAEKSVTTTTRLNEIKNEMAALGPLTDQNRAKLAALAAEGGHLQDGLNQARGALKTFGSEAPVLTAATNVARGLTGAFQAGAAAATLFGEKNTELEAVLVKVFQITSITQGIQEVLNAVNQKGSITVLQLAAANKVAEINAKLTEIQNRSLKTSVEELATAETAVAATTKEAAAGTEALAVAQTANAAVSKEAVVTTEALAAAQAESAIATKSIAAGTEALTIAQVENATVTKGAVAVTDALTLADIRQAVAAKLAAAAQVLLNLAVKAGPVGLFVVALAAAVTALAVFAGRAKEAKQRADELNASLQQTGLLEEHVANLKQNTEDLVAQLQARNAKESEITKAQGDALREIIKARDAKIADDEEKARKLEDQAAQANRNGRREALQKDADAFLADAKKLRDANFADQHAANQIGIQQDKALSQERLQAIKDEAAATLTLTIQNSRANFAAQRVESAAQAALDLKAAGDNIEKIALARAEATKRLRDIDAAETAQNAQDRITSETTTLIKIQTENRRINSIIAADEVAQQNKIIQDEANTRIAALQKQAQQDVSFRRQANIEIAAIQAQTQATIEENNRQQQVRELTRLENDQIAQRDVLISNIKTTNQERLQLQIDNEVASAAIAAAGTDLSERQRRAIIAQSNEKIRELRLAASEKELNDSLDIIRNQFAGENAEIERQLAAQQEIRQAGTKGRIVAAQLQVPILNVDQQVAQIQKLTNFSLDENQKRIEANRNEFDDNLIGIEDFTKNAATLSAERTKIEQDEAERIRRLHKETADFTKSTNQDILQASFQSAQQILGFVNSVFDAQDQRNQARIEAQRKQVQDELAAGEITAKAAEVRNKELDQQQKQLQRDQAKRQKEMALFNAIIQTASAVATALTAGPIAGVIAAATAAAIGAAEIAVIASTPIPQFYKGKNMDRVQRNSYEGWAELGERGAELWRSGSQTKLIEKSTIVWVKKGDTIYNAAQTASIMKAQPFGASSFSMNNKIPTVVVHTPAVVFDYKKLADAVSKKSSVSLNIDGYKDFILDEKNFTAYLNNRRKWL